MSSSEFCVYCDQPISPAGTGDKALSLEHVVGRVLGGALTIPTHKGCNGRANEIVDSKLAALPDLGRIRGRLGLRFGSGAYAHREVWESPEGIRAFIFWTRGGRRAKLIPKEIPRGDSGDTEVFIEPEDNPAYEEKRRKRVEREGCYLGEPRESTDPSLVGKEVAILFREPSWILPQYLWPATVAKFGLGVIADGCRMGLFPASVLRLPLMEGLRTIAFEKAILTAFWDADRFRYEPSKLAATSVLAQLERHEHLLAIRRRGTAGQRAVLQVVVFGRIAHELELPGFPTGEDRVWLFDSLRRKVTRLSWDELEERLSVRTPRGVTQLALEFGGLAPRT